MPLPGDSDEGFIGTPVERARMLAEKTLQRLRKLQAQFPSPDLDEAIRKLEAWRDEQLNDRQTG